jgi:hypothetical protein
MNKVNHSLGAIIIIFLSLFQKLAVGLVGLVERGGKETGRERRPFSVRTHFVWAEMEGNKARKSCVVSIIVELTIIPFRPSFVFHMFI